MASTSQSPIRIKTDAQTIIRQLRVLSKLAKPETEQISLQVKGNNLYLYSYNNLAAFKSLIPCDSVEGELTFNVSLDALRTLLLKRSEIELTYVNTMLRIRGAGGFKAEVATSDALNLEAIEETQERAKENSKHWDLTVEQGKWISHAVNAVNLKAVTELAPFMPATVRVNETGAFTACYDMNHLIFTQTSDIIGDIDLSMPCDTLVSVFDSFAGQKFSLMVSESHLVVSSELMTVALSLPINANYLSSDQLYTQVMENFMKSEGVDLTLGKRELLDFLDSCKAIATKERLEIFGTTPDSKRLGMRVKTANGNVEQCVSVEAAGNVKFYLDFGYFDEAVRKCDVEEVKMKVISDKYIVVNLGHDVYAVISQNRPRVD